MSKAFDTGPIASLGDGALSKDALSSVHEVTSDPGHDALVLARNGKRQVLKRRFGVFAITGLASVALVSWQSVIGTLTIGLHNGGPAGVVYGIIFCSIGMSTDLLCMGELSSMIPTAGGQYHWMAKLAGKRWKAPLSYITGWVTILSWVAVISVGSYFVATLLQQLIHFITPEYEPQPYQATLMGWATIICSVFINTVLGPLLPAFEIVFLVLHVVGFFAFLIPVVKLGTFGSATDVFTRFNDDGGWGNDGASFLIGIQGVVVAFVGLDCGSHMSEEVQNAELAVPRSMMISISLNSVLTFVITVIFLLTADLEALLASESQYPIIDLIYQVTQSKGATVALVSYLLFMSFGCLGSCVAAGSRMLWAFSRDRGFPFWNFFQKVDEKHRLPLNAIFLISIVCGLLGIIQIGSTVAFAALNSLVAEGFCTSYLCVLLPLLYRRIRKDIKRPNEESAEEDEDKGEGPLVWGPWHIPGVLGIINNAFACCFLVIIVFFSCWPTTRDVTAETFNFSVAVLAGIMLISTGYYLIQARKTYHGPIVEVRLR